MKERTYTDEEYHALTIGKFPPKPYPQAEQVWRQRGIDVRVMFCGEGIVLWKRVDGGPAITITLAEFLDGFEFVKGGDK